MYSSHISIRLRGSLPAFLIIFYILLEIGLYPYKRIICLSPPTLKKKKFPLIALKQEKEYKLTFFSAYLYNLK